jgi:hypothetical protein
VDGEQKVLQLQKKSQELEAKLATYTGFIFFVLLLFSYSRHKKHPVTKLEDGMVISSHEK